MDHTEKVVASPERPISTAEQDVLSRDQFVRRLCNTLIDSSTKGSTGVVVGLTGPWGSGKSSILNLLHEHIAATYSDAVVVRFDPWLISGREDLISQFFAEILAELKQKPALQEKVRAFGEKLSEYGAQISKAADYFAPGLGSLLGGGLSVAERTLKRDRSLHAQRSDIVKALDDITNPIVVFVDELDRVEDGEIKTVAQLVRSIADFPRISYLLAYDAERVIQALGAGHLDQKREDRGRGYLEKIVQLQIPIPVMLPDEIRHLVQTQLLDLRQQISLPDNWASIIRFQELLDVLIPDCIRTPRDVKRLIGTYHAIEGMVRGEVDWIDLLGLCVLLIKAPKTIEAIRSNPDEVVEDPRAISAQMTRWGSDKISGAERTLRVNPDGEGGPGIAQLLSFLFPVLRDTDSHDAEDNKDTIRYRRPLLTALRLGLLPGIFSRAAVTTFMEAARPKKVEFLQRQLTNGSLNNFLERVSDLYPRYSSFDHEDFWLAASDFLRKPDDIWLETVWPMPEVARTFANLFMEMAKKSKAFEAQAGTLVARLIEVEDVTLTSILIRTHIHAHGLFGRPKRDDQKRFLSSERTKQFAWTTSERDRDRHLEGNWLSGQWHAQPIYTMIDAAVWEGACRSKLTKELDNPRALDCFTVMLYGGNYSTEWSTVEKIVDGNVYKAKLEARLKDDAFSALHESVRVSLRKAIDPF